eukprot:2951612-Rhodomonas_salina.1
MRSPVLARAMLLCRCLYWDALCCYGTETGDAAINRFSGGKLDDVTVVVSRVCELSKRGGAAQRANTVCPYAVCGTDTAYGATQRGGGGGGRHAGIRLAMCGTDLAYAATSLLRSAWYCDCLLYTSDAADDM